MSPFIAAALLLGATAPQYDVRVLSGESISGALVAISDRQVAIETTTGRREFAVTELQSISQAKASAASDAKEKPTVWVELVDGSGLAATAYDSKQSTGRVTLTGGAVVEVPTKIIRLVRFRDPAAEDELAEQWAKVTATPVAADTLYIRKKAALDFLGGVIGDIDGANVQFKMDGEAIKVPRAKLEGIAYFHAAAEQELPEAVCDVRLTGGSRLRAKSLAIVEGNLKIRTPAGCELSPPLADIARIDFASANTQYLSDLEPESVKVEPYFGLAGDTDIEQRMLAPRRDMAFDQRPLKLSGAVYAKGLAMRSRTQASYRLPSGFKRLRAIAGLDDGAAPGGATRVEIKGDNRRLWAENVKSGEKPRPLDLDVTGVKRLEIVVDFGDNLDVGDEFDLCDARLTK